MKIALIDDAITNSFILQNKTTQVFINDEYEICKDASISHNLDTSYDTHADICSKIIRKYSVRSELINIVVKENHMVGDYNKLLVALDYLTKTDVDIVSMSIGITSKQYGLKLYIPIRKLLYRNVKIVASYSNDNLTTFPACFNGVMGCKARKDATNPYIEKRIWYATGAHIIRSNSGKILITPNVNSYATAYIASLVDNRILI